MSEQIQEIANKAKRFWTFFVERTSDTSFENNFLHYLKDKQRTLYEMLQSPTKLRNVDFEANPRLLLLVSGLFGRILNMLPPDVRERTVQFVLSNPDVSSAKDIQRTLMECLSKEADNADQIELIESCAMCFRDEDNLKLMRYVSFFASNLSQ